MRINTNMAALNAWRTMTNNSGNLQKSLERLASGNRLNRAADDAAGLAVSEKMNAQIRGLGMATRNTQDAISLVQTAEGGASKVQEMMQRMRELAVQAGSDTLQDTDRAKLQEEFASLQAEIDRTTDTVTFNGRKLINGDAGDKATLVSGSISGLSANGLNSSITAATTFNVNVTTVAEEHHVSSGSLQGVTNATIDAASDTLTQIFDANLGSGMTIAQDGKAITINFAATDATTGKVINAMNLNEFAAYINQEAAANGMSFRAAVDSSAANDHKLTLDSNALGSAHQLTVTELGFTSGNANFADSFGFGDVAGYEGDDAVVAISYTNPSTGATVNLTGGGTDYTVAGNTVTGVASDVLKGVTFNLDSSATGAVGSFKLERGQLDFQVGSDSGQTISTTVGNLTTTNLQIGSLSIDSKEDASTALARLDTALSTVSTERAKMGAVQNRLENTISNLQIQSENLTAANSRIRDLDMASEMAQFTKFQILSQASTAMLAQANQITQGVLSLLR